MKLKYGRKFEHGQILPIVAIGIFALAGMAVLLLDVGALFVNRRAAQNAADAGALAGARVLCQTGNPSEAAIQAAVSKYVTDNNAILISSEIFTNPTEMATVEGLTKGEVVVTAGVEHASFFARIFGSDVLSAQATAGAGCFPVQTSNALPLAWSCRPPVAGGGQFDSDSPNCDLLKLDFNQVAAVVGPYLSFPSQVGVQPPSGAAKTASQALFDGYPGFVYVIMDSDFVCKEGANGGDGDINCDIFAGDGSGRQNIKSGGERGWLNLNIANSNSNAELKHAIEYGVSNPEVHRWYSGIDGNRDVNYTYLGARVFDILWIPVFNYICDYAPSPGSTCYIEAHNGTADIPAAPLPVGTECRVADLESGPNYYHIVGYAPFVPTCAHRKKQDYCPGFALAQQINPSINDNTNTLEGYFINPESLGELVSQGVDLGVYTVSLTR